MPCYIIGMKNKKENNKKKKKKKLDLNELAFNVVQKATKEKSKSQKEKQEGD
jgi:hypothetical protein